jgi:hypothetical protein
VACRSLLSLGASTATKSSTVRKSLGSSIVNEPKDFVAFPVREKRGNRGYWTEEYNQLRPHRGLHDERWTSILWVSFQTLTSNMASDCLVWRVHDNIIFSGPTCEDLITVHQERHRVDLAHPASQTACLSSVCQHPCLVRVSVQCEIPQETRSPVLHGKSEIPEL